ncbi:hypothetical protein LSTR_LSTR004293, partial [Laodelphax striatellus]
FQASYLFNRPLFGTSVTLAVIKEEIHSMVIQTVYTLKDTESEESQHGVLHSLDLHRKHLHSSLPDTPFCAVIKGIHSSILQSHLSRHSDVKSIYNTTLVTTNIFCYARNNRF